MLQRCRGDTVFNLLVEETFDLRIALFDSDFCGGFFCGLALCCLFCGFLFLIIFPSIKNRPGDMWKGGTRLSRRGSTRRVRPVIFFQPTKKVSVQTYLNEAEKILGTGALARWL
jgi:hypothetical protein